MTGQGNVLASTIGPVDQREITFKVSDFFLVRLGDPVEPEWSEPVQFRFEQQPDGSWDMVLRTVVE